MARKKNVLLVGHIDHQLVYSNFQNALSGKNGITLDSRPVPPATLGGVGFENHCISEDVDVVIFCGSEHAEHTKNSFAEQNATKSIAVLLPHEAKKLFMKGASKFPQNIIQAHNQHISASIAK